MSRPGRGSDQFPLRLPPGLRDRIKEHADRQGRSMNAEVVSRLEESFNTEGQPESGAMQKLLGAYAKSLSRENDALRKAGVIAERLVFELASAIQRAAEGDSTDLARQVERAKAEPTLKRLISVFSIVDED